jgi:hypothetical protein
MVTDNMNDELSWCTNCGLQVGHKEVDNSLEICYSCQLDLGILRGNEGEFRI